MSCNEGKELSSNRTKLLLVKCVEKLLWDIFKVEAERENLGDCKDAICRILRGIASEATSSMGSVEETDFAKVVENLLLGRGVNECAMVKNLSLLP